MRPARRLGVLGGTFDPCHFGHLDAAAAARTALHLDQVLFIPTHDPPHRPVDPRATSFQRFALTALAINGHAGYRVSELELVREGRSYTIDTLQSLHGQGWSPSQLFFVLGADAFAEIATWHAFPTVLDAANFAVVARPGVTIDASIAHLPELQARVRQSPDAPASKDTGIFLVEARTRDVSSTMIRARLAAAQPVDDYVPAAVARHISAHHLYAVDDLHGEDKGSES